MNPELMMHLGLLAGAAGEMPVVVEAAHVYADKPVGTEVEAGVVAALPLIGQLAALPVEVETMLFVDDLVAGIGGDEALNKVMEGVLGTLAGFGYHPGRVRYESALVSEANRLLFQLLRKGKTKSYNGRVMFKNGWWSLKGKDKNPNLPCCELLDAVLYMKKLEQFGGAVTVLPESYQLQQAKTKAILAAAGHESPNVLVVFHDDRGVITNFIYWGADEE